MAFHRNVGEIPEVLFDIIKFSSDNVPTVNYLQFSPGGNHET
jgi:hypothetical protein